MLPAPLPGIVEAQCKSKPLLCTVCDQTVHACSMLRSWSTAAAMPRSARYMQTVRCACCALSPPAAEAALADCELALQADDSNVKARKCQKS